MFQGIKGTVIYYLFPNLAILLFIGAFMNLGDFMYAAIFSRACNDIMAVD